MKEGGVGGSLAASQLQYAAAAIINIDRITSQREQQGIVPLNELSKAPRTPTLRS